MSNRVTTVVDYQVREAIKALKDVESGLDGTETSAQRAAAQIRAMADVIEANAKSAAIAIDALSSALGSEFVADLERSGGSVQSLVADLAKAGVSFEDLAANADEVAAALRHAEDAGQRAGAAIGRGAGEAETGLSRVRTEGDNSRSVLANLVGNSVQDLGSLGGVAGGAGVAIGQLAEYATEGNISLSGLAATAGPLLGVGAALGAVTYILGQIREAEAQARLEAEHMLEVQKAIASQDYGDAAVTLQEDWTGTIAALNELGFSTDEVIGHMTGASSIMDQLGVILEANTVKFDNGGVGLTDYGAEINALIGNLNDMTNAFNEQGEKLASDTAQIQAITDALTGWGTAQAEAAAQVVVGGYALDEFTQKTIDAKAELIKYVLELNEVPADVKSDLRAAVASGDIARINAILSAWAQGVDVPVRIFTVGDAQGALGAAAAGAKSLAGRFTPAPTGGGGGGGSSSGGGGGGGGGGGTTEDPMAEWDAAVQRSYEYGEITLDEYRKYLEGRMNAYDKYSDEYFARWQQIQKLDKEEADAKKKADDEQRRRDEDEAKRAEDAKKRQEEQTQRELDRLAIIEGARLAALETFNGAGPMLVVNANTPEDTVRHLEAWIRNNGAGALTQGLANP